MTNNFNQPSLSWNTFFNLYFDDGIQISIVEEYRIFRTINLDKNDDFVHSTKMYTFILL